MTAAAAAAVLGGEMIMLLLILSLTTSLLRLKPAIWGAEQSNESIVPIHLAETAMETNYEDMWSVVLPIYGALRKSQRFSNKDPGRGENMR